MSNQLNTALTSIENTAGSLTGKIAYTSALGTGIMGWVGSNQFAVLTGFVIGVATFLVSWYYKHQEDLRRKERHELAIQEMKARTLHLEATAKASGFIPLDDDIDSGM